MKEFKKLEGIAAVFSDINIDTDAIIPKQFLKTIERKGLGINLFYDQRYTSDYNENLNFVLNKSPWRNSKIIIAGDNFGCGSSREHAPWALLDFGIKCIISTSFADIFFNNSIKNGLLPIKLEKNKIDILSKHAELGKIFSIDLINEKISVENNETSFEVNGVIKNRLVNGYDDIELTLKNSKFIDEYEKNLEKFQDWKYISNEKK